MVGDEGGMKELWGMRPTQYRRCAIGSDEVARLETKSEMFIGQERGRKMIIDDIWKR
jgi:hypothetical protein